MTILDHIYALQNLLNKGVKSDDAKITNELILHFLNISRLILLKREADKRKALNPSNFQGFCVPLCESSWVDCCGLPDDILCPILKSVFKLPKAMSGRTNLYVKVSYLEGIEIGRTTHRSYRFRNYSISQRNKPGWFILNDYLYVTGVPFNQLNTVWVDGLFEDPTDIADIKTCADSTSCYDIDNESYPIEGHLIEPMYQLTLKYLTGAFKFPDDNYNNAKSTEITNDKEE